MGEDMVIEERTSLSAGLVVYDALKASPAVSRMATKIFPVTTDEAVLPYVAYRRRNTQQVSVKGYQTGAETVTYEVACFAASYEDSVALAEYARYAIESSEGTALDGLNVRAAVMVDSSEQWQDDAYVQTMVFELKVDTLQEMINFKHKKIEE